MRVKKMGLNVDGDEIFDSAKPVLTSNLLANECVNGKFEVVLVLVMGSIISMMI